MSSFVMKQSEFQDKKPLAYVIDVRSELEHRTLPTISGDVNVPIAKLRSDEWINRFISDKDKDTLIVTYCNAGNRSGEAADFLRSKGFRNAFVLEDGIYGYSTWIKFN